MSRFLSLRTRLLLVCFLAAVPAFGMLLHTFSKERARELSPVKTDVLRTANLVAVEEQRRIGEARTLLVTLAQFPLVRVPADPACGRMLAHLLKRFPQYTNFGVTDASGNVVCSALPLTAPVNIADRDYFRRAVERRDFAYGTYQIGRVTHLPGINFAYPMKDGKNRLRGVVFAALNLTTFSRLEEEVGIHLPKDAALSKIDTSGKVIARYPEENGLLGKTYPEFHLVRPLMAADRGMAVEKNGAGARTLYAIAKVPKTLAGREIYVVLDLPETTALRKVDSLFRRNIAILGLLVALVLSVVWAASGVLIRRPIRDLLEAARRLAEGDAETRLGPPYARGELGALARNFDRMTSAIRRRRAEREQARIALMQSEENFRNVVRHAPFGIFQSSPEGRFLMVNPALVTMLGYGSEEELLKANLATEVYVHPEERQGVLEEYIGSSPSSSAGIEVEWKRKDGRRLRVRVGGRLVRKDDGSPAHFEVFVEDETERLSLEQQFRHAQRMEAVGRLAGGIAHDFNNLLGVILGYTEILLAQMDGGSSLRPKLEEIGKAAERASNLTRQLLAFSRKQVLQPRVVNLNEVVFNAKNLFQRLMGEDIELLLNLSMDTGRVRIDPGQLEQVIMNLVVNARDAMRHGGKLVIETHRKEFGEPQRHEEATMSAGSYALLAVSDTGAGMSEETRKHIFEPFFTTKEAGKGTGLGLSTAYGIVKQSGGYIWAYSEPGRGTTFKIYLPGVPEETESSGVPPAPAVSRGGSETVLVVEDESSIRLLVRKFLEHFGYRVLEACDSSEARRIIETHGGALDLLITDVVMPGGSGPDLARDLQRSHPGLKVLFMSGYPDDAVGAHGVLKEGTHFLSKPFGRETLAAKVREVLDAG